MKRLITILVLIVSVGVNSQAILEPNRNSNASELFATLSEAKDSLLLTSEVKISKVLIYNELSTFTRYGDSTKLNFPIRSIPKGKYTVEVSTNHKLIILVLRITDDCVEPKTFIIKDSLPRSAVSPFKVEQPREKIRVLVPYDLSRLMYSIPSRGSDTIYIKETRDAYRSRTLKPNGKRRN